MGKVALLFPGQGAQNVGMGRELYDARQSSRRVFDLATDILGWDLARLCFEGPSEELDRTARSQPAMLTVSIAILRAIEEEMPGLAAQAAAGLSLGEYSALVSAGALSFEDALRLVEKRSRYMETACRERAGSMISVLGLEPDAVVAICRESGEEVVAANFNSPGQVVVSGSEAGLEKVAALARQRGAKRTVRLRVEGAFHSSFMASARDKLAPELAGVTLAAPRFPIVANVTADYVRSPDEIRRCLADQVTGSVLWQQSMARLIGDGFDTFVEVGEGEVLSSIMRRILGDATAQVESVSNLADLTRVKERLGA